MPATNLFDAAAEPVTLDVWIAGEEATVPDATVLPLRYADSWQHLDGLAWR